MDIFWSYFTTITFSHFLSFSHPWWSPSSSQLVLIRCVCVCALYNEFRWVAYTSMGEKSFTGPWSFARGYNTKENVTPSPKNHQLHINSQNGGPWELLPASMKECWWAQGIHKKRVLLKKKHLQAEKKVFLEEKHPGWDPLAMGRETVITTTLSRSLPPLKLCSRTFFSHELGISTSGQGLWVLWWEGLPCP